MSKLEDRLTPAELTDLMRARLSDGNSRLTEQQRTMAAELQRALRQLPLELIRNHLSIALIERRDFDYDEAMKFARIVNDRLWEFY